MIIMQLSLPSKTTISLSELSSTLAALPAMLDSLPVTTLLYPHAERHRCSYPGSAPDYLFPNARGAAECSPTPAPVRARNNADLAQ